MKHFKFAGIAFIFILCLGSVLALGAMKIYSDSQQRKARNGLDLVVANDLPDREEFEVVEIVSFDFSDTDFSVGCYYARDNLIISTSFPESEAIDVYSESLQALGWRLTEQLSRTMILDHYEENTYAVVTYGEPGPFLRNSVDYTELTKAFPEVIFVRIDYMVPNRESC
jgi:hypothetical protein